MRKKKRVIIVADSLNIGGIEKSLLNMIKAFDYEKYEIYLRLYNNSGELLEYVNENVNILEEKSELGDMALPVKTLLCSGKMRCAMWRIKSKLIAERARKKNKMKEVGYYQTQLLYAYAHKNFEKEEGDYDLAIGYAWPHDYVLKNIDAKIKIGWVHTDYSTIEVDKDIDMKMWDGLDYIFAVSKECKRSFLKSYPSLENKTKVFENIIDENMIRKIANVESEIFDNTFFNVLSVGRLCTAKGFDLAIKTLREMHDMGFKNIKWHVVGFGPDEEKLKALIKEKKVENSFILHGKQTNPYKYIKECDLYVQPSRYEGKAVTVTEAKVLRKPIIITNYETSGSQVKDGYDGYISKFDEKILAKDIINFYQNESFRNGFIENCKNEIYENHVEIKKIDMIFK